ncbi:hypothetical protein [[Clostridium] colinum]|uniref:hypothetical protein n=1 Tax=[Clostridium] colinum TaxID=36835 RepID=UPI00202498EB|nr:hypothetical protein [[Clostridium] colinum]
MNQEKNENNLYMPSNLATENQIVSGIGKKEAKYFVYLFLFNVIVGVTVGVFITANIGILVVVPLTIFSYFLVVKNPNNNHSTMTQLVGIYKYYKKQNLYKYKYTEWWEKYLDEEEKQKTK